jgi:hypothetical protein
LTLTDGEYVIFGGDLNAAASPHDRSLRSLEDRDTWPSALTTVLRKFKFIDGPGTRFLAKFNTCLVASYFHQGIPNSRVDSWWHSPSLRYKSFLAASLRKPGPISVDHTAVFMSISDLLPPESSNGMTLQGGGAAFSSQLQKAAPCSLAGKQILKYSDHLSQEESEIKVMLQRVVKAFWDHLPDEVKKEAENSLRHPSELLGSRAPAAEVRKVVEGKLSCPSSYAFCPLQSNRQTKQHERGNLAQTGRKKHTSQRNRGKPMQRKLLRMAIAALLTLTPSGSSQL